MDDIEYKDAPTTSAPKFDALQTRVMLAQLMSNSPIKDLEERYRWIQGEEPAVYILTAAEMTDLEESVALYNAAERRYDMSGSQVLQYVKDMGKRR